MSCTVWQDGSLEQEGVDVNEALRGFGIRAAHSVGSKFTASLPGESSDPRPTRVGTPGSGNEQDYYQVDVEIDAWDRKQLLADVMNVINEANVPARSCKAWARKDRAMIELTVEILHKKQLEDLIRRLRKVKDVIEVSRMTQLSKKGD